MRAFHRTTADASEAILRNGFHDHQGTWGTGTLERGVWVTIDAPWDLGIAGAPPGDDPALLVIEGLPLAVFERFEWSEEGKGYREALVPASELNRRRVWRAWECAECGAVAREHSPGWHSELTAWEPRERMSVCPACRP